MKQNDKAEQKQGGALKLHEKSDSDKDNIVKLSFKDKMAAKIEEAAEKLVAIIVTKIN